TSTTLILTSATNFNVGNYVKVDPTGANTCSGTTTVCYAKITAIATNTLTITPALTWDNGASVVEVHVPEIGGINLSEPLANRYGRGYFIDGIVTGNGTTYFSDGAITLANRNLAITGGSLGIPVGSVGAPALFFNGDTDTGVYSSGSNSVSITTGGADRLIVASGGGITIPSAGSALIISDGFLCVGNGGNCSASYDRGTIHADTTTVQNVDLAETYPSKDTTLVPGEVVMIDVEYPEYIKRAIPNQRPKVIGVISTKPGLTLGVGNNQYDPDKMYPVALSGRIPVKVTTENGEIAPGDYLTSSDTIPGFAMKATKAGTVIGQALEGFTGIEGTISTFIKATDFNGDTTADPSISTGKQLLIHSLDQLSQIENSVNLSQVLTDRLVAGLEIITPTLTANNVSTNTISAGESNIALVLGAGGKFTVGSQTTNADGTTSATTPTVTIDSMGNATFAGTLKADSIEANSIRGIEAIANQISLLSEGQEVLTLTAAAVQALNNSLTNAQSSITELQGIIAGLTAGTTSTNDILLTLGERVGSIESLLAANSFTALNSVATTTLAVTGDGMYSGQSTFSGLSFFNNQTNFDGLVTFGAGIELIVPPLFNKDTAGFALIKKGDRRVEVKFNQPYALEPVVNTSMTFKTDDTIDDVVADALFGEGVQSIVVNNNQTGFTILLNKKAPRDIRFSWTALAVKDPTLFESLIEGLEITPTDLTPEPIPTPDPVDPILEPTSEPTPELTPEPTPPPVEPEPAPLPDPAPELTPEPVPEPAPTSEPTPDPVLESAPQ
ncbi:MAG: hypothetical protein AAB681_03175, partial [Patescibacteria group bacterium]